MRFLLPKPIHGWRAFWGEVGIIVLGVLIALAAQQLAEDYQQKQRLAEADRAIALELGEAVGQATVKLRTYLCTENTLSKIGSIVSDAERIGRLPPLGEIPLPRRFTWPSGAWQTLQDGNVAALEPRDRLQGLSVIYSLIEFLDREQYREYDVWTDLYQLVGPGRGFSASDASTARSSIGQARMLNRLVTLHSLLVIQTAQSYGIRVDRPSVEMYTKDSSLARIIQNCPKFGRIPLQYGEAPLRLTLENARHSPIEKPGRK